MAYNKNVVEDALFQIKNLEETLQENAKGILQSTMSEEIKQLVKESLQEQDDEVDLTAPEADDEMDMEDDEMDMDDEDGKFINEKSELFCLVMCIMLHNRDIFRFLLRKCCYIWNDVHLALLTNYVLEAQWVDGLKVLFTAASTH